jgi:hypothetical protein
VEEIEAEAAKNRVVDDEEGEDLCKCEFSLAYGAKILLNNATMHLKRGKRYGLCGPNGVGKSTLMRAIVNGQVDGFPSKEQVRGGGGAGVVAVGLRPGRWLLAAAARCRRRGWRRRQHPCLLAAARGRCVVAPP